MYQNDFKIDIIEDFFYKNTTVLNCFKIGVKL